MKLNGCIQQMVVILVNIHGVMNGIVLQKLIMVEIQYKVNAHDDKGATIWRERFINMNGQMNLLMTEHVVKS